MRTRFVPATWLFLATLSAVSTAKQSEQKTKTATPPAITNCVTFLPYSSDPNNIWNQVQRMLLVRTATDGSLWGCDEVDPLLWDRTQHVLVGEKYTATVRLLDQFLATHAENQVRDPLKQALFQRNLWAFFNWVAPREWPGMTPRDRREMHFTARQEISRRVAAMIRAVALSREEIAQLPDNFAPLRGTSIDSGFKLPDGDGWVLIGRDDARAAAIDHTTSFPRSAFFSYLRLSAASPPVAEYLEQLRQYSRTRDRQLGCVLPFDCDPPQFHSGT